MPLYPHYILTFLDDIRLVGGRTGELSSNGKVQVYREDGWIDVCGDSDWGVADAQVVCARLGFNHARVTSSTSRVYSRWMYGVTCVGNESSLLDCPHQIISYRSCTPASLQCLNCEYTQMYVYTNSSKHFTVVTFRPFVFTFNLTVTLGSHALES